MHEIDQITKMDIFYHAMNYTSKGIIYEACCGAFKRKSAEEANQLNRRSSKKATTELHLRLQGVVTD